jgi:RNA polymerase sigma factor (TIGR02999 family)
MADQEPKTVDITGLLNRWSSGDAQAFEELMAAVYGELKWVAKRSLQNESKAATLNCTALVHEAYLRLVDQTRIQWSGRAHFFGAAAQVMRRILVEHARQRLAKKRGSGAVHEPLDKAVMVALAPDVDVVALNEALTELAKEDPESVKVIELRCFAGLSIEETADVLGVSDTSVKRAWRYGRAWLYRRLKGRSAASGTWPP